MPQPLALTLGLSARDARAVRMAAARLKLRVRDVPQERMGRTLGELCGPNAGAQAAPEPPEGAQTPGEAMLVMAHFPPPVMDAFLRAVRSMGVRAPLKAVLTPTNAAWTPARLCAELRREREAIAAGQAAHAAPENSEMTKETNAPDGEEG